jgi:hypothetical protein
MTRFSKERVPVRQSVVVELETELDDRIGHGALDLSQIQAATSASKRTILNFIDQLRAIYPDIDVTGEATLFPVLEVTAPQAAIDRLSAHPLVKQVSEAPQFRLSTGS